MARFDDDIAISTRVRLARNYADLPFPAKLTHQQALKVNDRAARRLGRRSIATRHGKQHGRRKHAPQRFLPFFLHMITAKI